MLQDLQERLARLMQPGPPARPLDPENAAPIVDVQHLQGGEHGDRVALQGLKRRFVEPRQQHIVVACTPEQHAAIRKRVDGNSLA